MTHNNNMINAEYTVSHAPTVTGNISDRPVGLSINDTKNISMTTNII